MRGSFFRCISIPYRVYYSYRELWKDEAPTALIHLGYLGYDAEDLSAYIPNYEVASAYDLALRKSGWGDFPQVRALQIWYSSQGQMQAAARHWKCCRQCHLARCSIFCLGKQMVLPQNEVTHDFAP